MENATKALMIAGSVLISIIIITLLVRTYGNIGAFQRGQVSAEEAQRLEEFNKDYTKYNGQYVYGTEVITVINRSVDYKDSNINIVVKVNGNPVGEEYTSTEGLKSKAFKCTGIGYDEKTGRVNEISFVEKMYNGGSAIE